MTRWWVQVRALVAIGLLVLFAGMSIVLACAFAVLAFWLQGNSPVSWAWLRYLSAAAALVFLVCTIPVRALRRGGKDPGGIPVSKSEAPELWALVHAIADATRTRPPDEIRLVAEPNAFAAEGGRLLGLRARKRYLLLGAPVVAVLTDRQLAAVVSHEFGHYSDQDTRINPMVYRIRSTIGGVINELGPVSMEKGLLRGYLRWFEIVASGILERQEILADRFSVRTTDLRTAVTALEMVDSASFAWERFRTDYLDPARRYGGFAGVGDAFGRFFSELWLTLPESERHPEPADATAPAWSTHPPLRQRIDALKEHAATADGASRPVPRTAPGSTRNLCGELSRAHAVSVDAMVFANGRGVRPAFEEQAVRMARDTKQRWAEELCAAVARAMGQPRTQLTQVLDALATDGATAKVTTELEHLSLHKPDRNAWAELTHRLTAALELAAVASGRAGWRMSWRHGVVLDGGLGTELAGMAVRMVAAPDAVPAERLRLAGLGIGEGAASPAPQPSTTDDDEVVGALPVRLNGGLYDMYVHAHRLVFVPVAQYENIVARFDERVSARLRDPGGNAAATGLDIPLQRIAGVRSLRPGHLSAECLLDDGTWLRLVEDPARARRSLTPAGTDLAGTTVARQRLVAHLDRLPQPPTLPPRQTETLRTFADLETRRRRASRAGCVVQWASFAGGTIFAGLLSLVVAEAADRTTGYAVVLVLVALAGIVVRLVPWHGAAWRLLGGNRLMSERALRRRTERLAIRGQRGTAPRTWAVWGIVVSLCCPPMCVLGVICGIRSIREARAVAEPAIWGVVAIVVAVVAMPAMLLLILS
ncbi:M48 family metallopeptidase [Streptomyces avermitilis]|uniref:M48 family metallopeptidase n=1 Tax=Streptomyces avermitilis TaxID=33903 RepID=UPI0033D04200